MEIAQRETAIKKLRKYAQNENSIKYDPNLTRLITQHYMEGLMNNTKTICPVQIISMILNYVFDVAYDYFRSGLYLSTHNHTIPVCYHSNNYIAAFKAYFLERHYNYNDWRCYYCGENNEYFQHICYSCTASNPLSFWPAYRWELGVICIAAISKIQIYICGESKSQWQAVYPESKYLYGITIHNRKIRIFSSSMNDNNTESMHKQIQTASSLYAGDSIFIGIKYNKCFIIIKNCHNIIKETTKWFIPLLKYRLFVKKEYCTDNNNNNNNNNNKTMIKLINFRQVR